MALDPVSGMIVGNIASNILGGLFGRRSKPKPQVDPRLVEAQIEQLKTASELQKRLMAQEEENRAYFLQQLPFVRNVLGSALRSMGFSVSGEMIPTMYSPLLGQMMSLAQAQAGRTAQRLTSQGVSADVAERVRQAQMERTQQQALAQAFMQRQQAIPLATELAKQMQLAGVYSPTALQSMPSPLAGFGAISQALAGQQQMQFQQQMMEEERRRQQQANLGNLIGILISRRENQ